MYLSFYCVRVFQPDLGQAMRIVDLAGAPSEFSHYIYWKRQHMVKVHAVQGYMCMLMCACNDYVYMYMYV